LEEGAIALEAHRLPSVSLSQSIEMQEKVENSLREFPEVTNVFSRIGTAEVATDPQGPDLTDVYVMLKPQREWKTARTKQELVSQIQEQLSKLPGQSYAFSQPIQMREEELIAGVKADLAVKVFGDEIQELIRIARETADLLDDVPGAQDVSIEQIGGLPVLQATVERSMIARYGVNVSDVLDVIEAAIGGKTAGQLFQGDKRFDIVVRLPATLRGNIAELKRLTVKTASGAQIPLDQLAQIEVVTGLNQINRENASRRVAVQANIRGRDLATFVADFRQRLAEKIEPKLPPGYHIELGGQFENLQAKNCSNNGNNTSVAGGTTSN
jgi:cobalt-zinc-cadmium resistance protein CzcA